MHSFSEYSSRNFHIRLHLCNHHLAQMLTTLFRPPLDFLAPPKEAAILTTNPTDWFCLFFFL